MRDALCLCSITSSYKMMNPISGIILESLFRNVPMMMVDIDEIDRNFEDSNSN
jgi:hypothetical protein